MYQIGQEICSDLITEGTAVPVKDSP